MCWFWGTHQEVWQSICMGEFICLGFRDSSLPKSYIFPMSNITWKICHQAKIVANVFRKVIFAIFGSQKVQLAFLRSKYQLTAKSMEGNFQLKISERSGYLLLNRHSIFQLRYYLRKSKCLAVICDCSMR